MRHRPLVTLAQKCAKGIYVLFFTYMNSRVVFRKSVRVSYAVRYSSYLCF